jgi:SOS response regulatory protein OraA/RecX
MQEIHLSPLSVEEARKRYYYLQLKLWHDQYAANFFVGHPIPEVHLSAELKAFWEGRIQEIHGWKFWENIWDKVVDAARWVWNNVMYPVIDAALRGLGWIAEKAKDLLELALRGAAAVGGWLWEAIRSATSHIWDFLRGIGSVVASALRSSFEWIWSGIQQVGGSLRGALDAARNAIVTAFSTAWEAVKSWIGRIMGEIIDAFRAAFSWLADAFKAIGSAIGQALKWVWDNVLVPAGQAVLKGLEWIWGKLVDAVSAAVSFILNALRAWAPMTPERAPNALAEVTKLACSAVIALGGLTLIGEAVHPLKQMGFPHLAAILYDLSGYKLVTGAAFTAIGAAMFGYPFKYFFMNLFRPRMPEDEKIVEAYLEGEIDETRAKQMLGYCGFSDDYFRMLVAITDKPVSPFILARMAEMGYYDYDLFERAFRDAHYGPEVRKLLHEYMKHVAAGELRAVATSVTLNRYRDGLISAESLQEELRMLHCPPALREAYVSAAMLARDYEIAQEAAKAITSAYRKGKLTLEQAKKYLLDMGFQPDWVQAWAAIQSLIPHEDIERSPEEEVRATGYSVALRRFREGFTTEAQLRQELAMLGYTQSQIERLVALAKLEMDYELTDRFASAVFSAHRRGKLTLEQAKATLIQQGISDEWVDRWARLEASIPHEDIERSPEEEVRAYGYGVVIKRFKEGFINEAEARQELAMLGYTPAQIERLIILARLEYDYEFARDQLEIAREGYRAGVLTDEEFLQFLAAIPIGSEKASAYLALEQYRKMKRKTPKRVGG